MDDRIQQLEILNELAMAIGQSLDRDAMLGASLPVFLHRLGCMMAGVVERTEDGTWEMADVLPRKCNTTEVVHVLRDRIGGGDVEGDLTWSDAGRHYYAWHMGGNHYLVLGRSRPFLPGLICELGVLARRLGVALESCRQYQALQQARQLLTQEAARHHAVLHAMGEALIVLDGEGRIRELNRAAEQLLGVVSGEVAGRPVGKVLQFTPMDFAGRRSGKIEARPIDLLAERSGAAMLQSLHGESIPVQYETRDFPAGSNDDFGFVVTFRDMREHYRMAEQIHWQATHDPLTGLPNRRLLTERLEHALAQAERYERLLAVALIDLDGFKPVNDRYGHETGDALLRAVAERMGGLLRSTDTLARLGGDEFVVLLEELQSMQQAKEIFDRLVLALTDPFEIDGHRIGISASLGYTLYPILDKADSDTLIRHADQAMYRAKEGGRNRCQLFDAMERERQTIEAQRKGQVREALENGEFLLHYQPKVDLRRGHILGFEGLARWQRPGRQIIHPGEFLRWIREYGLTERLGRFVLETAGRQLREWQAQGRDWSLSVNISPDHFLSPRFMEDLDRVLREYGPFHPSALEIEIVESVAIGDPRLAKGTIEACQRRGVAVALDDFGVGYASLSYLKNLPVDHLKVDRSFVRDMLADREDLVLIESIVALAHLFGRKVIAEGIETAEQGVLLMRLGCDRAQGYAIARPMPIEQVGSWVDQWRPAPAWSLWADVEWSMDDLPLILAQHDHRHWVDRVLATLEDAPLALERGELEDPHQCRLGRWYDSRGRRRYGHLPAFQEIAPIHAQVHEVGRRIVDLAAAGRSDEAAPLRERLLQLREEITQRLQRLQRQVAERLEQSPAIHRSAR